MVLLLAGGVDGGVFDGLAHAGVRDSDHGMKADAVADKYQVSASWVRRLKQRRRETGEVTPRRQTRWRPPILAPQVARLEALIAEQPIERWRNCETS